MCVCVCVCVCVAWLDASYTVTWWVVGGGVRVRRPQDKIEDKII